MNEDDEGTATSGHGAGDPTAAELERLFSMSLDLLCIAGLDGYFKYVNPAFTRLLGYREDDLLSKAFIEFVHPDDHENTFAAVAQLAEGLDVVDFENRYHAADGSWFWLAWRSTSAPDEGLIFAVARDITEHKRLQELTTRQAEELVRSNAELEQFASIASHDLQAPLRSVANLAEWIEEDLPDDLPKQVAYNLQTLRSRTEQMQQLVVDLLAYARVGRETERIERTDAAALVAEVAELLGPPEGFTVEAAEGLPLFDTTRTPLAQVFRNLITNALAHHDRPTGTVTVDAVDQGEYWEFIVVDDGPGIPEGEELKIFDMLWSKPGNEYHGAGMGLALVERIVERHGGRAWAEPSDGRGAVLRFTWPKEMRP